MMHAALSMLLASVLAAGPLQKVTVPAAMPGQSGTGGGPPSLRMPEPEVMPAPEAESQPSASSDTPQAFDATAYRDAVKRARTALADSAWADAERNLEQALAMKPDAREVAYNLGLARFQQGDYAGAAKFFQQSAQSASADLAARSMYNQGNSLYAQSLKALPQMPAGADGQEPPIPPEALQQAMQQVDQALTHFKDAAAANPSDEDSAANAESSLRLLKELRKLQQEQQQQQQKQDQKNQQQPQDQQQKQDQKNQQQPQDQQQKQDQKNQQQPQDQQQKQDQKNQQQPQDQQQKQDPQPGSTGEQAQGKTPNVDREQADRLLQMVRDKEKERNAQKRQAAGPARPTPVDRDW